MDRPEETTAPHEEIVEAAYAVCMQVVRLFEDEHKIIFTIDEQTLDAAVNATLQQHVAWLKAHNIQQKHIDPFKIGSWLGCILAEKLKDSQIDASDYQLRVYCDVLIDLLSGFLYLETDSGYSLDESEQTLLENLLLKEALGEHCHGIWMNGLFIAFHSAKTAWLNAHNSTPEPS